MALNLGGVEVRETWESEECGKEAHVPWRGNSICKDQAKGGGVGFMSRNLQSGEGKSLTCQLPPGHCSAGAVKLGTLRKLVVRKI